MLPDRVSNPGPLTYESGVLPIALRGPANLATKIITVPAQEMDEFGINTVNPSKRNS